MKCTRIIFRCIYTCNMTWKTDFCLIMRLTLVVFLIYGISSLLEFRNHMRYETKMIMVIMSFNYANSIHATMYYYISCCCLVKGNLSSYCYCRFMSWSSANYSVIMIYNIYHCHFTRIFLVIYYSCICNIFSKMLKGKCYLTYSDPAEHK